MRWRSRGWRSRWSAVASHDEGLARLRGRRDPGLFRRPRDLIYLLLRSGSDELWVSERQFTFEPYALALARGDDDFRLLVDATLSELYGSGAIEQFFTAAFGAKAKPSDMLGRRST